MNIITRGRHHKEFALCKSAAKAAPTDSRQSWKGVVKIENQSDISYMISTDGRILVKFALFSLYEEGLYRICKNTVREIMFVKVDPAADQIRFPEYKNVIKNAKRLANRQAELPFHNPDHDLWAMIINHILATSCGKYKNVALNPKYIHVLPKCPLSLTMLFCTYKKADDILRPILFENDQMTIAIMPMSITVPEIVRLKK